MVALVVGAVGCGYSLVRYGDGLGEVRFATQTTLKVDVAPVRGEANKDNNSAQYSVIFSLP